MIGAGLDHQPDAAAVSGFVVTVRGFELTDLNTRAIDVGAGTSFSLFKTMDEAYKIQQLRGSKLDPFQALYFATLGGAAALKLDHCIGNLAPGNRVLVALDDNPGRLFAGRVDSIGWGITTSLAFFPAPAGLPLFHANPSDCQGGTALYLHRLSFLIRG